MVLQLNEIFDRITAEPPERRRLLFHAALPVDPTIATYLRMAFTDENAITGLEYGIPEHRSGRVLIDKDIPPGMGLTTLRSEVRRVALFGPKGAMQKLSPAKRLEHWSGLLSGLQWQEAELLTLIKDRELQTRYPWLVDCLDLVGIPTLDPAV